MSLTGHAIEGEFRAVEGSRYYQSPLLYKENGFKKEESAKALIGELTGADSRIPDAQVLEISRKQENKEPAAAVQSGGAAE